MFSYFSFQKQKIKKITIFHQVLIFCIDETHMESGYIMKPIGVKYNLRRGVRNVKNGNNKNILKGDRSLDALS